MKARSKQKVIIGTLIAIILGMVVGYAALSQILNINGTSMISGDFKIEFTKIDENTMVNSKTVTKGGIGTTTANFTVDLDKPGSSALYDLTVENKGSIDAILTSIEGLDESNEKEPVDILYSITGIKEGDALNAGASHSFQVQVVWKASATSVPTTSKTLTLKLNYEQKSGTGVVTTPESFFEIDESGIITNYTGEDTDVVIPDTIQGIPVTKIGDSAFKEKGLTSVKLPETVTELGPSAFSGNKLTSIEIPNSVTSIESYAFNQNQLTSVIIPNSVTDLGSSAFANNKLTSVEISNQLTSLNYGVFQGNKLTNVKIPDSVTEISGFVFQNNQLTSVVIPDNVTTIGELAFGHNQLTNVTLGGSVQSIASYAFEISTDAEYPSNPNLTKIINKSGNSFNWYEITRQGAYQSAPTGTFGQVTVTAE